MTAGGQEKKLRPEVVIRPKRCRGAAAGIAGAHCDRFSRRSALQMLGRIAPITRPELSPPSTRAVASYVTATASAVTVSTARTPNMPTARQFPARQEIPWAHDHGVQQHSQGGCHQGVRAGAGHQPGRTRGDQQPCGHELCREVKPQLAVGPVAPVPRTSPQIICPPHGQQHANDNAVPGNRDLHNRSLWEIAPCDQGQPATAAPDRARGLSLMSTTSVRSTARRVESPSVPLSAVQRAP